MASQQTEIDASRMPERWTQFLSKRFGHFDGTNLERFLVSERNDHHVLPAAEDAFRSLMLTPPDRVNVVIFGQDPYPTPGHAHGLSFSVRSGVSLPASLRNIFRELKDDLGIPPARNGDLTEWATQGVLLLNRVLTVRAGAAGSHRGQGWEALTDQIIASINSGSRRVLHLRTVIDWLCTSLRHRVATLRQQCF